MKNTKTISTLWMALLSLMLLMTGCASSSESTLGTGSGEEQAGDSPSGGKTLTLAFPWSPAGLDPHSEDSWEVMRSGTAETLIRLNKELEPTSWLAKEWTREDENTWIVKLEENVTFHNGKVMDAASVKASLERSMEKSQRAKDLLQIESMDVLSKDELKLVTKYPNSALIAHLADPLTIIVDVSTIEEKDTYPALTGPFKFKQFNKDESLIVEKYQEYWGEPALLSELTIKFIADGNTRLMALQSGDVDGATDIPIDNIALLEKDKNTEVMTAPSLRTHMVLFNMDSPLFKDVGHRRVIDMTIPREAIVSSVMMGYGTEANGPFSDVLPFGKVERKEESQSIEEIMAQGGWNKNAEGIWEKDGQSFEVTMLTFPQRPELSVMAEVIQHELLEKGIKMVIRQVENIDAALANEDWDLSMYSMLTAHTGDPQYFLNIFYRSGSESNVSRYVSSSVDHAIDQLNQTMDPAKRIQLAVQTQDTINQDLPQSFVVHPKTVFAVRNGVKGFIPHPIEYYYIHSRIDVN